MTQHFDCPICGALDQQLGYCWECGYDAELDPDDDLIDQLDSELECQKIDTGFYDRDEDDIYE